MANRVAHWARLPGIRSLLFASLVVLSCVAVIVAESRRSLFAAPESKVVLQVEVSGLRNTQGQLALALFNDPDTFPDETRALRKLAVGLSGSRVRVVLNNLQAGTYALSVLHDENSNGKMDYNWAGIPKEGYGFSNNAMGTLGPPSFKQAALHLSKSRTETSIRMRYSWP